MVGHCGGLRQSQIIGDYVLAHGYLRRDRILDGAVPPEIPIPALAEVQVALQEAAAQVTGERGDELKRRLRTGTVVTYDDRNWELRWSQERRQINLSRAIAVDMESGTIAAQGYRLRVPYGTLLCVSDKPLHGEIKLPGAANAFYERAVSEHLMIGLAALDILRGPAHLPAFAQAAQLRRAALPVSRRSMSRETLGLLLGFVGVCIFAGTLPFTHIAVEHLSPLFVTAGRAALAGLLALATLLLLRRPWPSRRQVGTLVLVALCLVGGLSGLHGACHAERAGVPWRRGARHPAARHLGHQHPDRGRAPEPGLLAGGFGRRGPRHRLHPARGRRLAGAGGSLSPGGCPVVGPGLRALRQAGPQRALPAGRSSPGFSSSPCR